MVTNNMKDLPSKDRLHAMYITQKMSIGNISFLTGHAQLTIKNLMKEYKIEIRKHGWVFRKYI